MPKIKPIEPTYNGYRFRSRLEARWALYFDLVNIKYEYEPEGYVLENGECYLPDFYLPEVNAYFEVKHASLKGKDVSGAKEKLELLAKAKDCFAMLCRGDPVDNFIVAYIPYIGIWTSAEIIKNAEVMDDNQLDIYTAFNSGFVVGGRYKKESFECRTVNGHTSRFFLPFNTIYSFECIPYKEQLAARQARFEHGECGT